MFVSVAAVSIACLCVRASRVCTRWAGMAVPVPTPRSCVCVPHVCALAGQPCFVCAHHHPPFTGRGPGASLCRVLIYRYRRMQKLSHTLLTFARADRLSFAQVWLDFCRGLVPALLTHGARGRSEVALHAEASVCRPPPPSGCRRRRCVSAALCGLLYRPRPQLLHLSNPPLLRLRL